MSQSMSSHHSNLWLSLTEWRNNILLQPKEKIWKRCPKWVQCAVTYIYICWTSYILFWIRNSPYNFLLLSGFSYNRGGHIYICIYIIYMYLLLNYCIICTIFLIVTNSWLLHRFSFSESSISFKMILQYTLYKK